MCGSLATTGTPVVVRLPASTQLLLPGESSPPHSHPCPVLVYVIAGMLRTQVRGEPEAVYGVGEGFYEAPGGVHIVSANASGQQSARFVAVFLCDRDTTLSVAAPVSLAPREERWSGH